LPKRPNDTVICSASLGLRAGKDLAGTPYGIVYFGGCGLPQLGRGQFWYMSLADNSSSGTQVRLSVQVAVVVVLNARYAPCCGQPWKIPFSRIRHHAAQQIAVIRNHPAGCDAAVSRCQVQHVEHDAGAWVGGDFQPKALEQCASVDPINRTDPVPSAQDYRA